MTKVSLFLLVVIFASCSTNKVKESEQTAFSNAEREDKVIGAELPEWADQNGIKDGRMYEVGYAELPLNKSEHFIKKAALMDAEVKLLSESPTDFRIITQNALTGAGIDSSEFYQIQTSLKEAIGVTSMKSHKSTCRKIVRNLESSSSVMRGCWYQASVGTDDLRRAYQLTLQKKYGVGKANKFDGLMKSELDKINDQGRFTATEDKNEKKQ
jgi:hypothetical protein